jgi:uncharacterized membrane protein
MKMLTASSQCWSTIFCALSSLESPLPTLATLHEINEDAYSTDERARAEILVEVVTVLIIYVAMIRELKLTICPELEK